jgi:diguanylate cyclase (GGDEF)-like protein
MTAPAATPAPLHGSSPRGDGARPSATRPPSNGLSAATAPFIAIAALAAAFVAGQALHGRLTPAELVGAALLVVVAIVAVCVIFAHERAGSFAPHADPRLVAAAAVTLTVVVAAAAWHSGGITSPYLAALPLGAAYVGLVLPRKLSAWVVAVMTLALLPLAVFGPTPTWLEAMCVVTLVPGGRFFGVLCGSAHRRAERVARQLTRADRLTRTLSRQGFLEELQHALVLLRRAHTPVALFLIDLDAFKEINSARGGSSGDELLAWCGQRLAEVLPKGSTAGRLGGDEFGVATANMDRSGAEHFALELRDAIGERHPVSIGVATSEDSTVTVSDLLRVGNAALHRAKSDRDRRIHTLVAGGVRPEAGARVPEPPVLTYERLRVNGGRPRRPTPSVLVGIFMSRGLLGLGFLGACLSLMIVLTSATEPSLWTTIIQYGWVPWVAASIGAGVAARFVDPMNMRQVTPLIIVATLLAGGGTGVIALAQGGGVLEPIVAGLALRVLFDTSVAFRPQAAVTLAGTLVFFVAVVILGPASSLWAVPFHVVLLGSAYGLGQVAQRGFIQTTDQWLAVARTDMLTGLRNRLGVEEDVAHVLQEASAAGQRVAIVSVDIDRMRAFNDRHGHPAGDAAIQQLAAVLTTTFSAALATGRLGADEFVAAVPVLSAGDADRLTATIEAVLRPTIEASAGVAVFPDHGRDLDGLLHVADVRRRSAKAARREREDGGLAPTSGMHAAATNGRQTPAALAGEHDGALLVDEHQVVEVRTDCAREHDALDVAADALKFGCVSAMVDAKHVLFDDRSVVEHFGDVVRGGADQLDAAFARPFVWPSARERRKERVVDVDDRDAESIDQVARQDLHVAREDDQVDRSGKLCEEALFSVGPAALLDGDMDERDAERFDVGAEIFVVGDDACDLHRQLSATPPPQQVEEAVVVFADHQRDALKGVLVA